MREIDAASITRAVAGLCIEANIILSPDIRAALVEAKEKESSEGAARILEVLIENSKIAASDRLPICQDTGMAVVFIEIGQDVHVIGGDISEAINKGVREGYERGYLRKSVVADPLRRVNTGDNTPAVIYYDMVPGENIRITVAPKGFGSENMSAVRMLTPSDGRDGVMSFIVETVKKAGPNPCPPIVVGVGVGGTMDKAALMSKLALTRRIGEKNPDSFWGEIEAEALERINRLNIGPAGLGGNTTVLAVHIDTYPTHIAGLPVAVNIGCHVTRHVEVVL